MNIRVVALGALMLVATACGPDDTSPAATPVTGTPVSATPVSAAPAGSAPAAPGPGTSYADLAAWVKAGTVVSADGFHTATMDGLPATGFDKSVDFISPSGKLKCAVGGTTMCDVKFTNPVATPSGQSHIPFQPDIVEYQGSTAAIGQYNSGVVLFTEAATLPYGSSFTTGSVSCRMDQAGLFCVDSSAQSGIQLSDSGLVPYGCLQPSSGTTVHETSGPQPFDEKVGQLWSC